MFKNFGTRTFGDYGEDDYHREVTERVYEEHRFQANRAGRRKNRHELQLVATFLAGLPADKTILDVPCGMGRFTELIVSSGHTPLSIDLNVGMLERAQARHGVEKALVQGDVFSLPLNDQSVDAALCFRLLHHLPDNMVLDALSELRRVTSIAFITYYDTRYVKYQRKRLLGKKISGQYYPAKHMMALCAEAGWADQTHINPFDIHRNLHAIQLAA